MPSRVISTEPGVEVRLYQNPATVAGATIAQALDATVVTSTAAIVNSVGKLASATATSTATIVKQVSKTFSATATSTATAVKSVGKVLSNGQWYRVEMAWKVDTAGNDYIEGWIDGVSFASSSTTNISTTIHNAISIGGLNSGNVGTADVNLDDIAVNDDQGASQNTLPGSGKVVLCVPISDAQVGSWTGGVGGVTNLYDAVNNKPPIGTATETDLTQIESIDTTGDNSVDEYRANLTTYTNAGLGASDSITLVQPILNHGEDIATGTKTGSVGMQANPADTYAAFTFGNDVGALGTFPSNWSTSYGTPTYAPAVTLGSSPVLAVRKTDAGTRVASVDAMGLYVEYVPFVAPDYGAYRLSGSIFN